MNGGEILLDYQGADVGYGGDPVVRDATFRVRSGEIVGLVGPNGAGKSTLLRAVTGEARVSSGSVVVAGEALDALSARERAAITGVVPQQVTAAFSFPAREFVEMGRHPHLPRFGRPGAHDREAVEWAMRLTDTLRLADTPIDALSGGDLQRLAFAQALATRPRLLLLDEATAHLDLNHRLQVLDLTRELADEGLAVLAVFHDLDLAARYADRIAIVANGGVSKPVPPGEAITAAAVHEVFGVRAVVGADQVTGSVTVTPVLRVGAVHASRDVRVHLVGGAGSAAPLMRRLVLAGFSVTAGALNAGDADALLADALGIEYALIPPFEPMNAEAAVRVAQLAEEADVVVVCPVPFGHGNIDNLLIGVHARKPTVLIGDIEGRDYAGGAARSYWAEAIGDGAVVVRDAAEAEATVIGLLS